MSNSAQMAYDWGMYREDTASDICRRIASGETLRAVCRSSADYPAPSTFLLWVDERPLLAEQYARARRDGLDAIADEAMAIADDQERDPNDRRVAVDTRKWLLSKLRPDKYGDRSAVELTGAAGGPIQSEHKIIFVEPEV